VVDARSAPRRPLSSSSSSPSPGARIEERSAGAVVFRRASGSSRYLLLKYPAGHWDLPKGNIEAGEEPLQTMAREVMEETGITDIHVFPGFMRKIEYFYRRDGRKAHKTVVFFLAETPVEKVTISFEHQDYGWFDYAAAMRTVTYPNARMLIRDAESFVDGRDKPGAKRADLATR
jgi:bis(5'-nucleosidyl)-tetraphosphatase